MTLWWFCRFVKFTNGNTIRGTAERSYLQYYNKSILPSKNLYRSSWHILRAFPNPVLLYSCSVHVISLFQAVLYPKYNPTPIRQNPSCTYVLCTVHMFVSPICPEAIFTYSSRIKFAKCSPMYSGVTGVYGWVGVGGREGGGGLPSCGPHSLTLPYTSLYISTVYKLCLRTTGEYPRGCPPFDILLTKYFPAG